MGPLAPTQGRAGLSFQMMCASVTFRRLWTTRRPGRNRLLVTVAATAIATSLGIAPVGAATSSFGNDPPPTPTFFFNPLPGAAPLPDLKVQTWLIADAGTGAVLASRDPKRQMPPASTLKALTALTLLPRLKLDSTYRGTTQDAATEGAEVGIEAGADYSVQDLFNGLLLPSGNDAASALANAYGGLKPTVEAMNSEAKRLKMTSTVAKNPSGLDDVGQLSTAWDLATLLRNAVQTPLLRQFLTARTADFPAKLPTAPGVKRGTIKIYTANRLLLNNFPGTIGGKTGFTSHAGRTFIAAVQRDGRTLLVVLMRSSTNTERAAEELFTWGFANADKLKPVGTLPTADPAPQITPQSAALLDVAGRPMDPSALAPAAKLRADGTINSEMPGDGGGGGLVLLAILGWLLVDVFAAIVVLRIRAVRRINRRRAARAKTAAAVVAAQAATDYHQQIDLRRGVATDQRPVGSDTNPTRS